MCGIAGFFGPPEPVFEAGARNILEAMTASLQHRGPDSSGVWVSPVCGGGVAEGEARPDGGEECVIGFGHARLAIVDLSPAGYQPMHYPSAGGSRFSIVYNGEIYNHLEIRSELRAGGYLPSGGWKGHSDTETLLAAVGAWGVEEAVRRTVGMFAFALWDAGARRLSLVRDRMGIKPLYYGLAGDMLVFGSELKALRAFPGLGTAVDRGALGLYLRHGYVPEPHCMLAGLRKLPPASILHFSIDDLGGRTMPLPEPYWSVNCVVEEGRQAREAAAPDESGVDRLESLLREAVGCRLMSDVPLGAFLSGGIDSSTVVALMQKMCGRAVRTFTIGTRSGAYDEAAHARAVAAHLGSEHTELYVEPDEVRDVIPLLPSMFDEPFADSSQIPTYIVSRLARESVTVSLSGDGGDELFGGYNRHLAAPGLWARLSRLSPGLRRKVARLLRGGAERAAGGVYDAVSGLLPARARHRLMRDKLQKVVEALDAPDRASFYRSLCSFWQRPGSVVSAYGGTPWNRFDDPDAWPPVENFSEWMMAMDLTTYLPGDILTKVDRASMAVSLEARVPLLDHRVAEFAWTLPLQDRIRAGQGKWLLRQVLYRHVPKELVDRPKSGFGIPLDEWLRGPLRDWAESLLDPDRLKREGWLQAGPVRTAWKNHLSGRRNLQHQLWAVLMFQAWLDEYGD